MNVAEGLFLVPSGSKDGHFYEVTFDSKGMPNCDCLDWKRHHLPCKHFCAVFTHFEQYGWDALPPEYRRSPFYSLDEEIVGHGANRSDDCFEAPEVEQLCDDSGNTCVNVGKVNVPERESPSCRELLSLISNVTYMINDDVVLDELHDTLHTTYQQLVKCASSDGQLILNECRNASGQFWNTRKQPNTSKRCKKRKNGTFERN